MLAKLFSEFDIQVIRYIMKRMRGEKTGKKITASRWQQRYFDSLPATGRSRAAGNSSSNGDLRHNTRAPLIVGGQLEKQHLSTGS